jgi:paired amphipathic helix protein Sin3a
MSSLSRQSSISSLTASQYPAKKEATVRWLQKDETTFYTDEMERKEQWQYYISSYMRIEHTEGVIRSRLQKVLLERNLPSGANDSSEYGYTPKPVVVHEGLILRICLLSYKIVYEKGTADYFIYNTLPPFRDQEERDFQEEKQVFMRELREERFKEKLVMNSPWMKNMSQVEVQKINEDYQRWKDEGALLAGSRDGDVAMAGVN